MPRKKALLNLPSENENRIVLQPGKYPNMEAELKARDIKLQYPVKTTSTQNAIVQDLVKSQGSFLELIKKSDPTQIPFVTTSIGNMLVNPSTVSISTLMKVAQNEIVAKCMSLNSASVVNTLGEIRHKDKRSEKMLQKNVYETEGGLRDIVEKIMTDDVFGFSLNYLRDYIDNNGECRLQQIDLLPPSGILFSATPQGNIQNIYQYIYSYPYANTQNLFSFPFNAGYGAPGENVYGDRGGYGVDPLASYDNVDFVLRSNVLNTFGLLALDKSKIIHSVCDSTIKIQNPYGYNPLTRRVYDLCLMYDLYKQLHSTFLSYRACPLLVGYADANKNVDDPTGQGATLKAIDALYNSMAEMGTNGALILSGRKDEIYSVEAVQSQGDTKAFENALTWYANQIQQCMGQYNLEEGSFASATAQTSIYGRIVDNKKSKVSDVIRKNIFKYLLQKNIDPKITDFGYFENDVINLDDRLKVAKINNEASVNKGFMPGLIKSHNDYQAKQLGYPVLTDEEFEEIKKLALIADHPMDNTNRVHSAEAQDHYNNAAKHDGI